MYPLRHWMFAAALLVASPVGWTEQAGDAPSVSHSHLKGPLHILQGRGGTVLASVGEDGALLIDADYAEYAPAYAGALEELAPAADHPRFVLNTHWHGDHVGGNEFWAGKGAVLLAHTNVRLRMSTRQEMKAMGRVVEPSPEAALPMVTYDEGLALHFNGDDVEVQHFPRGHTDGDSVVFFARENVVHMGDLFFKDRFPFVDVGSGGNVFNYIENIERILARIDSGTIIVPGHGGPRADKADLERYRDMLVATSSLVKDKLARGQSEESITAEGLGEQWASWGQHFINEARWISFIVASL